MNAVKALMLGDVVGESGLAAVEGLLGGLIATTGAVFVVVNGENGAGGFGLTAASLERLLTAGVDVVTSGNHIWEKREFWPTLQADDRILRPGNYPVDAPGRGFISKLKQGVSWTVVNLQGREGMTPIDCPFRWIDEFRRSTDPIAPGIVLIDFHAESSQEKEALGLYCDGWASALVGTHTHVATSDERLLPNGTAYVTDLGMSGDQNGIIGMDPAICLERLRTLVPRRMECAVGSGTLRGVELSFDADTGKALSIRRVERGL